MRRNPAPIVASAPMPLTLRAVSLNAVPLSQPILARFDAAGGTIGRAENNTMALPDPERHISRRQAQVSCVAGAYAIRNVGAANPITIDETRLLQGESVALAPGARIVIGGYVLEVVDDPSTGDDLTRMSMPAMPSRAASRPPAPDARPTAVPTAAPAAPAAGLDVRGPLSSGNPFAGLLGPPTAVPFAARGAPVPATLPEDFDPFADPFARTAATAAASHTVADAHPFADLVPDPANASIDSLFGLGDAASTDPLSGFLVDRKAGGDSASRTRSEVFAAQPSADRVHELHAALTLPTPRDASAPAPATRAARPAHDDPGLWAAFCAGASIRDDGATVVDPRTMEAVGALLRAAVDGVTRLIAIRSATRHELHADVTVIRSSNNNPLKFSPDAETALEQLLKPPIRGFMPGPIAMEDAMNDLVGHAIGTMAGTRAALEGVLARFAPPALESKLSGTSMLDSVLPMNRRSKLWELYLKHFETIREEAAEDFQALFGKAFLQAYEEQVDRLARENAPRPSP